MKIFGKLAIGLLLIPSLSQAFYGRNATEAELRFDAVADIPYGIEPTLAELNQKGEARDVALEWVDSQIQHLMGTFQSGSFLEEFGYPGVLGESYELRFKKVEPGSRASRKRLTYEFVGKVVFHKDAFRNKSTRNVPIKLPVAPDLIYQHALVREKNRCSMDEHYDTEGDFWYFWDADKPGCPLRGDSEHVLRIEGQLKKLQNTVRTYPEYDKLYGANGNGEHVDIAVFLGYLEDIRDLRKAKKADDAFDALWSLETYLKGSGFELTEKKDGFREYANGKEVTGINYLRRYERGNVRVMILLADTAIESRDATFHRYLREGMRDADVLVYDGHSGLGGNLDLGSIEGIEFNPQKYQVFYFNGCSSYPYFNGSFFNAKGGTKNLEIITSGLPTYSNTAGPNLVAFLGGFLELKELSYQKILQDLERSNGDMGTYLVGVNGDEDNKYKP